MIRLRRNQTTWRGVRIPDGSLDTWRAARDQHATRRVEVVCFGDSTTDYGSDGNSPGYPARLRALAQAAGLTDGGRGLVHNEPASATGESLASVQGKLGFGSNGGSYDFHNTNTVTDGAAAGNWITFQGYGRFCRLHHGFKVEAGGFTYSVDGGAAVTVEARHTSTTQIKPIWIDLGSDGLHTITITNLGGAFTVAPAITQPGPQQSTTETTWVLPASTQYHYRVSSVDAVGETVPGPAFAITTASSAWPYRATKFFIVNEVGAVSYKVYRASAAGGPFELLATVAKAGGAHTFVQDTGGTVPNPANTAPTVSTAGRSGGKVVTVSPDFLKATGLVIHNQGVSGTAVTSWFGTPASDPNVANWASAVALGILPSTTGEGGASGYVTPGEQYGNPLGENPRYRDVSLATLNLSHNGPPTGASLYAGGVRFARLARRAGADPLIILPHWSPPWSTQTWTAAQLAEFRNALMQAAVDEACAVVDFDYALRSQGYSGSGPHLNPATGYDIEAQFLWSALSS